MPTNLPTAPETAIAAGVTCCGGPPETNPGACCQRDEDAKAASHAGCGGRIDPEPRERTTNSCCG